MKKNTSQAARAGFTLIEILTVVCIITILIGLTANATFSARQKAYASAATTEAEQVSAAFKAYQIRHVKWPLDQRGTWVSLTRTTLAKLIGDEADEAGNKKVLLDIPDNRWETGYDPNGHAVENAYCDPWGNVYQVWINSEGDSGANAGEAGTIKMEDTYEFVVSFPMQHARYYDFDVPWIDTDVDP